MDHQSNGMRSVSRIDQFVRTSLERKGVDQALMKAFIPRIFEMVHSRPETDPVIMYLEVIGIMREEWSASASLPIHGAWHHALVPGIIIQCLKNLGRDLTKEDVQEAMERGMMVPGGSCGFHGACGAAIGVGIAVSVIERTTPLHEDERSRAMRVTSRALACMAELKGPRCCPRATYSAFELASLELGAMDYPLPMSGIRGRCSFSENNSDCIKERCPFFPREF